MKHLKLTTALLLAFFSSSSVLAGGYRVSLQGVKQAAMGHAGVAIVHDASSIFFNPAGIVEIEDQWSFSVSGFGVNSVAEYQNLSTLESEQTKKNLGTPFAAYAAYKPNEKIAFGVGVYTPYGSTVEWEEGWSGRALIQKIELQAIFLQPTVAYKFDKNFSFGAGLTFAFGKLGLKKDVDLLGNYGKADLTSDDVRGYGYNAGLMYTSDDKNFSAGLNYRSEVNMKVINGDAKFEGIPQSMQDPVNGPFLTLNDKFNAQLPLASELTFGVAFKPVDKLLLTIDVNYGFWDSYERLDFDFEQNLIGDTSDPTISSSGRYYKNTITPRIGAEYAVSDNFVGRLGYYYDPTPSPSRYFSPETPTTNQHGFTGGLGYRYDNFTVDASLSYLYGEERTFHNVEDNFSGNLLSNTLIFGLGFSYNIK